MRRALPFLRPKPLHAAPGARAFGGGGLGTDDSVLRPTLKGQHLLSLKDFSAPEILTILELAKTLKHRIKHNGELVQPLKGETVGMIFQKRSTRTRVSTEAGVAQLGGHALFLGSDDIQLGVNESVGDTGKVLSRLVSCVLARVYGHAVVEGLSAACEVPVINGLSDTYHPLQILADLMTLQEHFGSVEGLTVAWVGDGNNILHSFMAACPKLSMNLHVATPAGFDPMQGVVQRCREESRQSGTRLLLTDNAMEAVTGADVVVTDTWISMGQEDETTRRLKSFEGYQVTEALCAHAAPNWRFLHCLPRKSYEVDDAVFYGDRSLVWDEAENRKWTVMAVILSLLRGGL